MLQGNLEDVDPEAPLQTVSQEPWSLMRFPGIPGFPGIPSIPRNPHPPSPPPAAALGFFGENSETSTRSETKFVGKNKTSTRSETKILGKCSAEPPPLPPRGPPSRGGAQPLG